MFQLVSRERFRKALLLLRDRLAWSPLGRYAQSGNYARNELSPGFPGANNGTLESGAASASSASGTVALHKTASAVGSTSSDYPDKYTTVIDTDILDHALFQYSQDKRQKKQQPESDGRVGDTAGTVVTSVDHHCHVIRNASLYNNGVNRVDIFDEFGTASVDYSFPFRNRSGRFASRSLRAESARHIAGRTLCLHGDVASASGNYAHWLIDGLPRLFMAEAFQPGTIDQYLIPPLTQDFVHESLAAFGVDASKTVSVEPLELISFDELVCVSPPRGLSSNVVPPWAIRRYQSLAGEILSTAVSNAAESVGKGERIYVSRRDAASRTFTNEEEVADLLERHGYRSVALSDFDFAAKIRLFASASKIVSLTGAGLTNMVFCAASTHLLELMPSSHVTYLYSSIAGQLEMDYRHHIFEHQSFTSRVNPFFGSVRISPDELEKALIKSGMTA